MSAERNMPRTAIGAVHQLLFALRELRQGMGHTNVSEEVHALSLRSATYLGLYSLEHASLNHAHRLSQEYVSDVFDALHSASKRWKEHLNSTVTVNKNTSTPAQIRELATQASELSFATQGLREASSSAVYIPPPISFGRAPCLVRLSHRPITALPSKHCTHCVKLSYQQHPICIWSVSRNVSICKTPTPH